eukprot:SAG11_NODE_14902_length_595_cov_1.671371_1_plen_31_part_10
MGAGAGADASSATPGLNKSLIKGGAGDAGAG